MDVKIPEVPPEYGSFREEVRSFIAAKRPRLEGKQRAGARVLESERDVAEMRRWIRDFYDSGYRLDRYEPEAGEDRSEADPFKSRIIREELARAGVATSLGNTLVAGALRRFGTEEQRRKYLPPLERGDHIWTQLFSEPNAGSDLASLQTRARREGDHYVVDGQKVWSTYAHIADYGFLLARTNPDEERHGGMLEQKAGDAAERKLRAPATAVSGEDHQIHATLGDATQDLGANIAVDRHQAAHTHAVAFHVSPQALHVDPGGARVAVDEALLEIVLLSVERTGARALGPLDDVEEE